MRFAGALGVLCLAAAPAMGYVWPMDFDITSGTVTLNVIPPAVGNPPTVTVGAVGTFSLSVNTDDEHIGQSDFLSIDDLNVTNTATIETVLIAMATTTIKPGSLRFTDFATLTPGHIDLGGVAYPVGSSYLEGTILVVGGGFTTTFATGGWEPTAAQATISTSVGFSDIVTASLSFNFAFEIGVPDLGQTLTLDFVVDVVGTAHVPEPALASLVTLGLGGAGAWLRRRRG